MGRFGGQKGTIYWHVIQWMDASTTRTCVGAGCTTVNGPWASSVGLAYQDTAHRSKQMHGHQTKSAQRSESDFVYMSS